MCANYPATYLGVKFLKVPIEKITRDPALNVRAWLDRKTVERYAEILPKLPPVTLYDTPDELLLSDGFHRVEAAITLGWDHIEADVREGTRADAEIHAAEANVEHGRPLTRFERREAILRLLKHLGPTQREEIAKRTGVAEQTVRTVMDEQRVAAKVKVPEGLDTSHLAEIAKARREQWQPLVTAAHKRGWTVSETRNARLALNNKRTPKSHKSALLAGKADPFVQTPNGKAAVDSAAVGRALKRKRDSDVYSAALSVIQNTYVLKDRYSEVGDKSLDDVRRNDIERLVEDLDRAVEALDELRDLAKRKLTRLEVVA